MPPTNPKGYKNIEGFPKYSIDKNGSVYSEYTKKVLKPTLNTRYLRVSLMKDKKLYAGIIHKLVAKTYIPNPHGERNVCHRDGNSVNNNIFNLYWGSLSDNAQDSIKHGTFAYGERHGKSVLNWDKVRSMRKIREEEGTPYYKIAEKFGVCKRTAMMVCDFITWKEYAHQ